MPIFEIEGVVQDYAWGSRTAIAELRGRTPSGGLEAELWLGTHPRGPARLVGSTSAASDLRALIGSELPFLFKVLAADRPLSLQAHPNLEQAQAGFEAEERAGVSLDAPTRNYRDQNHKPELICAITDFDALSGFRPPDESAALLREFGLFEGLSGLFPHLERGDLQGAFRQLFDLSEAELLVCNTRFLELPPDSQGLSHEALRIAPWLRELARVHPKDPGVLAAVLLNHVCLAPGQAMFLPAGNLHAYLRGVGFELMASSDNVMRGGLTPKHVDVQELCRILKFEAFRPDVLDGELVENGRAHARIYKTPAREFELSRVELSSGGEWQLRGPILMFVEAGSVALESDGERLALIRGQTAVVVPDTLASLTGSGKVAVAALPRK